MGGGGWAPEPQNHAGALDPGRGLRGAGPSRNHGPKPGSQQRAGCALSPGSLVHPKPPEATAKTHWWRCRQKQRHPTAAEGKLTRAQWSGPHEGGPAPFCPTPPQVLSHVLAPPSAAQREPWPAPHASNPPTPTRLVQPLNSAQPPAPQGFSPTSICLELQLSPQGTDRRRPRRVRPV